MRPPPEGGLSGQQEYIARLRCPGGAPLRVLSRGSGPIGAHGHVVDGFQLRCDADGSSHMVYMDMSHGAGVRERRHVSPFSVLAEHPALLAFGCPPRVEPDADSSARSVFRRWEVGKEALLTNPPPPQITGPTRGFAAFDFIVDTTGVVDPASVTPAAAQDSFLQRIGAQMISAFRFQPAEHSVGCRVRQFSGFRFSFAPQEENP